MTTASLIIKSLSIVMILIGALFICMEIPASGRISAIVTGGAAGKWRFLRRLMAFFIIGYLFFALILFFTLPIPIELLTGGIILCSAIFVYLLVNFTHAAILDRKKAEDAAVQSELCFRTIFDSVSEAIIVVESADNLIIGVNEKVCNMFGVSHGDACGYSLEELLADSGEGFPALWKERQGSGEPWSFECKVKSREGRSFWVEGNSRLVSINGSDRILLSMRDVSGRKILQERVARLNGCFLGFGTDHGENIQALTALCGEMMEAECALYNKLEGVILNTAASWNAPLDYNMRDTADGHLCNEVITAGSDRLFCLRELGTTPFAESDKNVRRYGLETYLGIAVKCADSYVGSLCVVYRADYSPTGEDEKFMGILAAAIGVEEERRLSEEALYRAHAELESRVRERTSELARANELLKIDISQRMRVEEALRQSESILRKVFEAIPDMLAVIDREMRIVHSNWQGGYEYVPQEQRNGATFCFDAFYPQQGKPCPDCHVQEVFRTGMPVTTEKVNPRIGLVEIRVFPIYGDSGEVVLAAEYIRNITETRRVEEELRKSQKLESLGILAGGIAHDFNNILTGILGNISLAKVACEEGGKSYLRLDEAERAVWRARDLTQQLMTFSRGGAPVKKTASITQIVRDSASFVLRGSNVRCEVATAGEIWPVEVDEGQMSQVINNLIINADQAMVDGGVVRVTIENVESGQESSLSGAAGRQVMITVTDHGEGIAEENIHRIFDPYFTTKSKGSGLGLATVYSIVRNHDGFIDVESEVGKGTTFRITIPASEREVAQTQNKRAGVPSGSGRVLLMDDEELIRSVGADILNHLGYEPVVCSDGKEALDIYRRALEQGSRFYAVIMDLTIPGGMGGRETMKRLREMDSGVVGIVSSGYCNDPILANFGEYGFRGIVEKPYSVAELGRVLHGII